MQLWFIWWGSIYILLSEFSHMRTFMWFAVCVAGLIVWSDKHGITRVDGQQAMTIYADLVEGLQLSQVLKTFEPQLAQFPIRYEFKGEAADQAESGAFLLKAFIFAIFLMAIILVTQFNSYYQVAIILSAVVFSSGGVLIGLMAQQMAFSIVMTGIGVISLAGIVVNNNIVLIDTFNSQKRQGLATNQAVLMAVYLRLRPVMLTTVTTILGLLPMAMGWNIDLLGSSIEIGGPSASVWSGLATAIVWGLSFASIITLLITPCLLLLGDRFKGGERVSEVESSGAAGLDVLPQV